MTVINAMKFNEESGAMVADTQSSYGLRKTNIAEKIQVFELENDIYLIGSSGYYSIIFESIKKLRKKINESIGEIDVLNSLADICYNIRSEVIEKELLSRLGIGFENILSGKTPEGSPIDEKLLNNVTNICIGTSDKYREIFRHLNNYFLLLHKNSSGVSICGIEFGNRHILNPMQYATIGSGAEQSDSVLREYLERLTKNERRNIKLIDGILALVRATNKSSEVNQGVGGTPDIAYFNKNGVYSIDGNASLLISEIIKCTDAKLIEENAAIGGIEEIINEPNNYREVEDKLIFGRENSKDILRFLRGHNIL